DRDRRAEVDRDWFSTLDRAGVEELERWDVEDDRERGEFFDGEVPPATFEFADRLPRPWVAELAHPLGHVVLLAAAEEPPGAHLLGNDVGEEAAAGEWFAAVLPWRSRWHPLPSFHVPSRTELVEHSGVALRKATLRASRPLT
ncbi:MAG TPA: hypothetical protein VIK95_02690, partial [Egibacteraceae bacterium]